MARQRKATKRSQVMLEQVFLALGQNVAHERWIKPYKKRGAEVSVLGLAESGLITVSPLTKLEVIIHEALHNSPLGQRWSEKATEEATDYLYHHIDDATSKRIVEAFERKAKRIKKPTHSAE